VKIMGLTFDNEGHPDTATAILARKEMQLLAKYTGAQSHAAAEEFLPGHGTASCDIYVALSGVFDRYWEDGVDEAIREGQS
jgi:hypothetical protein